MGLVRAGFVHPALWAGSGMKWTVTSSAQIGGSAAHRWVDPDLATWAQIGLG
jgi:hypothetical protein